MVDWQHMTETFPKALLHEKATIASLNKPFNVNFILYTVINTDADQYKSLHILQTLITFTVIREMLTPNTQ